MQDEREERAREPQVDLARGTNKAMPSRPIKRAAAKAFNTASGADIGNYCPPNLQDFIAKLRFSDLKHSRF